MGIQQSGRALYTQFTTTMSGVPKLPLTCRRKQASWAGQQWNNMQAIERFDFYVDLSNNNSNLPTAPLAENMEVTLYGFSQFDILDMRVELTDTTDTGVPVLRFTPTNQTIQALPPSATVTAYKQPNSIVRQTSTIK